MVRRSNDFEVVPDSLKGVLTNAASKLNAAFQGWKGGRIVFTMMTGSMGQAARIDSKSKMITVYLGTYNFAGFLAPLVSAYQKNPDGIEGLKGNCLSQLYNYLMGSLVQVIFHEYGHKQQMVAAGPDFAAHDAGLIKRFLELRHIITTYRDSDLNQKFIMYEGEYQSLKDLYLIYKDIHDRMDHEIQAEAYSWAEYFVFTLEPGEVVQDKQIQEFLTDKSDSYVKSILSPEDKVDVRYTFLTYLGRYLFELLQSGEYQINYKVTSAFQLFSLSVHLYQTELSRSLRNK